MRQQVIVKIYLLGNPKSEEPCHVKVPCLHDFADHEGPQQEGSGKELGDREEEVVFQVSFHWPSFSSLQSSGFAKCLAGAVEKAQPGKARWSLRPGQGAPMMPGPSPPCRYLGKEGWAPASYLKKAKDELPARKKNLAGPVEIIGNIMEISNLLNKKASGDKETPPAEGEGPEPPITKKEISLPILCNASNGSALGIPERTVSKLAQGSPAVARIAPQRAQISKSLSDPQVLTMPLFREGA